MPLVVACLILPVGKLPTTYFIIALYGVACFIFGVSNFLLSPEVIVELSNKTVILGSGSHLKIRQSYLPQGKITNSHEQLVVQED